MRMRGHIPASVGVLLTCVGLLAGCAGDSDDPPRSPPIETPPAEPVATDPGPAEPTLTADGWGELRIGMSVEEVVAAAGPPADPDAVGGPEPEYCSQLRPERAPEGMLLMMEAGALTRISIDAPAEVRTDDGFGVGDSADAIIASYGDAATVTPHKYLTGGAQYITVWKDRSGPEPRGIVYETGDDHRVTHIHAGGPSIQNVEGCL